MYYHGRRRGQEGVGAIIDFLLANARLVIGVGGAAILGIATLAVKRLIERAGRTAEENKPITDSWEELGLGSSSPKLLKKGIEGVVMKKIAAATKKADLSQPAPPVHALEIRPAESVCVPVAAARVCVSLQERLQQYYATRVCVCRDGASRAQRRALEIGTEIHAFLRGKHTLMPLGELRLAGSLLDDLQVLTPDHTCLLVHLQVEESLWSVIRGEDTFLSHPQLFLIRRENLEYFPRGRSYWDHFLVGGYLSARLIAETLAKSVTEAMNWPSLTGTLECEVRPVLGGDGIKLEVCPGDGFQGDGEDEDERLFVRVLPTVRLGEESVCARPRPPCEHAWFHSLYPKEAGLLASRDQSDGGVRRKCLKTMKAICRTNPALRRLSGRHLSNLLLHLSDKEADWSEEAFSGRFQQAIEELIGHLELGKLPSYFTPAVNLLQEFSEDDIDEMGFMLYCAVSQPEILLI
ncbi:mitochondrial dynamics protein MID49 [Clupea harengus]|uniref:Mitochondrial dynamics protein MID49 n=1 Tax=Clupea harengus TaxID=7950 RepID=A0A6P8ETZ8_CLUHA|nr:mitochondrial dynamics protein MID49 [Clupea harengus]XP_031419714.1 mitochondrial dynamics protein MID49 [Clupea harengus]XP_031419715.1 mitochondrial dynamics protein MID49 [Clupea harengus]